MATTTSGYTDNAELRALVRDARATGQASNRLVDVLTRIITGANERHAYVNLSRKRDDLEDFVQACLMHLLQKPLATCWIKGGSPFNFFTTCVKNFGNDYRNAAIKNREAEMSFAALAIQCGRPSSVFEEYQLPDPAYLPVPKTKKRKPKRKARPRPAAL